MTKLSVSDLEEAGDRFVLDKCFGSGVFGIVRGAIDTSANNKKVAIKIQKLIQENENYINEEYKILRDFSEHINLPDFYGGFRNQTNGTLEVWFVMELCEGGPVIDLVNALIEKNRRMSEEHIAFILKEVVKALSYLHENHIIHRDVKGTNILMTSEGEIKLVDFGLSRHLSSTLGRTDTNMGSPCWMAPEVVTSSGDYNDEGYGNRADVWAVGITAIELGDGKTPFCDMHPTRALFQIVRNPPPTLYRKSNWSEAYNDFVSECLVKNPEYRPYMMEILEHPFLTEVPENCHHLTQELKSLRIHILGGAAKESKHAEAFVKSALLKKSIDTDAEKMNVEDLAALDYLSEESVLKELESRMVDGNFQTYIGDILLVLNPNEKPEIYNREYHKRYSNKSRSANAPHIYSVADSAYQNALHHMIPQYIILTGESNSGKTTNYLHLMDHLLFLGESMNINMERIRDGIKLIHWFTHAATPINPNSTRCILKTEVIYGRTAKVSGCTFHVNQLDKLRVSSTDSNQANFHIFYYVYDGLLKSGTADKYFIVENHKYRYLREGLNIYHKNPQENFNKFRELQRIFEEYEFSKEQIATVYSTLCAILHLGEIEFRPLENDAASIETEEEVGKVASLLGIDQKKLSWSLVKYCFVNKGTAVSRPHTCEEASTARDVLANALYTRLIDYVRSVINHKLSFGRAIFGEKYWIRVLDMCGLECFKQNGFSQLLTNTFNEQLHYLYLQRIFAWEFLELNEEGIPHTSIQYYDNKNAMEEILGKGGLLSIIDDTSKNDHADTFITESIETKENSYVKTVDAEKFSIAHFTGKIPYYVNGMGKENRDFLPPEITDSLRTSENPIIRMFFTNKLNRTGNLNISFEEKTVKEQKVSSSSSEDEDNYSQSRKMRSVSSRFRAFCLELMKELAIGGGPGGTHFVRCIRSDIENKPRNFQPEIIQQQLKALAVLETTKARQKGYPHRIAFSEFLRRYKFLAFDFDENVDTTRDNCRLLLVRLKMEGWVIGKTKVFLRYYNEEYLARLYEVQVKKIIRTQCMMRSFLAKRRLAKRIQKDKEEAVTQFRRYSQVEPMSQEDAAVLIQKVYRGHNARKTYKPLTDKLDEETRDFIKPYVDRWRKKSLFQVILQYRAAKHHDLFNFAQQVHFFNQKCIQNLQLISNPIDLGNVEVKAQASSWLQGMQPPVLKLPFRLDDVPYFDTAYMCDRLQPVGTITKAEPDWNSPFQWRDNVSSQIISSLLIEDSLPCKAPQCYSNGYTDDAEGASNIDQFINAPYSRIPITPRKLSTADDLREQAFNSELTGASVEPSRNLSVAIVGLVDIPPTEEIPSPVPATPERRRRSLTSNSRNTSLKRKETKNIENALSKATDEKFERPDPISELKHLVRRLSASEDEPPFNFQGMLRKTNFQRESLKRAVHQISISRRASKESIDLLRGNQSGGKKVSTEIAPGVILEGVVVDL